MTTPPERDTPRIPISTVADLVAVSSAIGAGWIIAQTAGVLIVITIVAALISWSNRA